MSKNIYTEFQIKELEKNPNIINASERSISYNPEFTTKAVKAYKKGKFCLLTLPIFIMEKVKKRICHA
ncbi:hypothetical protein [Cytobacillus purgationiresistens]|uniref:Transposase n=1 Tax=Cytobacillus purgationiresistens TaxID=863449 RepID=A0ABU0ALL0_9BACI|nr:hypothetical protein [Cytobacillus purgationiresistens]